MNARIECTGGRKLLAALAVLAVAFVVLAAMPMATTDSDAAEPTADLVIGDAQGLWDFAAEVNDRGNSFAGKLVVLDADIDLGGAEWTPIGQSGYYAKTWFLGTFDGRGHTVSNFEVTKDVWEQGTTDSEGNPLGNEEQGDTFASGFFGFVDVSGAAIRNLTVDGAKIYGCHWCGVIAGWFQGTMVDCHVTNSTVSCVYRNGEASGDKAGALAGYIQPGNGAVVDCSASDCRIDAARDAGQLIGTAQTGNIVSGCTAENVVVSDNGTGTGANISNSIVGREIGEVSAAVGYTTTDGYSETYYATVDRMLASLGAGVEAHIVSDCTMEEDAAVSGGTVVVDGGATFTVSAELTIGSDAKLVVKSGAVLQVVDPGALKVIDVDSIVMEPGSKYVGPVIIDDNENILDIDYADGSQLTYDGIDFIVYHIKGGTIDVPVAVACVAVPYTGSAVDERTVRSQTIRVLCFDDDYNAQPLSWGINDDAGSMVKPGVYRDAVWVQVQVTSKENENNGMGRYVDTNLVISPVDISGLDITVEPSRYVYTGDAVEPTFKVGMTAELEFDITKCEIAYYDSSKKGIDEAVDVGSYYAVVTAADGSYYTGATDFIPFEIVQAEAEIVLVMDGDAWTVGGYEDGTVSYELGTPGTDGALRITAYVTWAAPGQLGVQQRLGATVSTQDDLDAFIAAIDSDSRATYGYTVSFVMDSEETENFKAGVSDTVGPVEVLLVPEKIGLTFSDVDNSDVKTVQDGNAVTVVSKNELGLAKTNGRYTFTIDVEATPGSVVLVSTEQKVDGRIVMAAPDIDGMEVSFDNDENVTAITFSFKSLPVQGAFTVQVLTADRSVYIESDIYTIDLSGLVSNDLSIWLHDGDRIVKYSSNQLYDLVLGTVWDEEIDIPFLNGGKFYMPATQASELWNLEIDGTVVDTYQPGSVYLIDGDDRSGDGIIHFYASGEQVLDIVSVGYAAENANDAINAALKAAGSEKTVSDADPAAVMYIVFTMSEDGTVAFFLDGVEMKEFDFETGVHAIYWTDDGYVAGQTVSIGIADGAACDGITYTFIGGDTVDPEPEVEYSTDVKAALRADGTGVYLMLISEDDKIIPSGEITVSYTYTAQREYFGTTMTTSVSGSFTQDYTTSGRAYAIIALDFEGKAAADYATVVGGSAVYTAADGSVTASASQMSFTLPELEARS